MDIDMGKSQETKNIIWLTYWESSKESMIDSYTNKNTVF